MCKQRRVKTGPKKHAPPRRMRRPHMSRASVESTRTSCANNDDCVFPPLLFLVLLLRPGALERIRLRSLRRVDSLDGRCEIICDRSLWRERTAPLGPKVKVRLLLRRTGARESSPEGRDALVAEQRQICDRRRTCDRRCGLLLSRARSQLCSRHELLTGWATDRGGDRRRVFDLERIGARHHFRSQICTCVDTGEPL